MSSLENKSTQSNSEAQSQLSTPPVDVQNNNKSNKAQRFNEDGTLKIDPEDEMPQKPFSAYWGVCSMCLMIAFGGMIFGYDTGSISGFVNMSDFIQRFGSHNSKGYYLSNVRTGLIVSIFNIGCAIGGLILGKLGDIYGRKIALMVVSIIFHR